MKKSLIPSGALGMLVAAPALAQTKPTMEQIMQELNALGTRVGRLEQDNAQLKTENAALQAENERLEATSEYLKDNATATRKQLAQDAPKVAEAERITQGRGVGLAHQLEGGRALPPRVRGSRGGERRPDAPAHPRAPRR